MSRKLNSEAMCNSGSRGDTIYTSGLRDQHKACKPFARALPCQPFDFKKHHPQQSQTTKLHAVVAPDTHG